MRRRYLGLGAVVAIGLACRSAGLVLASNHEESKAAAPEPQPALAAA
ncbi:MAG: hypothetical protein ABIR67_11960 [Gaiellaceae bacterium]